MSRKKKKKNNMADERKYNVGGESGVAYHRDFKLRMVIDIKEEFNTCF
jgi:hypothetical protein